MKKCIPVILAIIMIIVVAWIGFGNKLIDKYSYSEEVADLDEYFGVSMPSMSGSDGNVAIMLQDELIEEQAVVIEGEVYFGLDQVKKLLNDGFYVDEAERKLIYTTADDSLVAGFDERSYTTKSGVQETEYVICRKQGEKLYLAAKYVRLFTNFSYELFDRHIQLNTSWGVRDIRTVGKATQVRVKGGIKSPILAELQEGDTVILLAELENWSKVKTEDSIIGYVENKRLTGVDTKIEMPVNDVVPVEYASNRMQGKVCLGWHAIGGVKGNDTLDAMIKEGVGMNVIAPTWFSFTDNDGNFRSFAKADYVKKAHEKGLKVWGVWDDFNYRNETDTQISTFEIFSSTTKRTALIDRMIETALTLELDGINLDFEKITADAGPHYVQFLRELSIPCREKGIVLSVDNYMPNQGNTHYRLDVQGQVADYVILMGYDEHWHGSKDPGSVASIGFVSDGIEKTLKMVPAEKIVNALPFYTIQWKTEGAEVTDSYVTLVNQAELVAKVDAEPVWKEDLCQYYLEWEAGGVLNQIWLEEEESIKAKLNVMSAKKLGGVAVWRLGYGTREVWQLLQLYTNM